MFRDEAVGASGDLANFVNAAISLLVREVKCQYCISTDLAASGEPRETQLLPEDRLKPSSSFS